MQTKRFPWFEILILVVTLAVHGYAAFSDAGNFPNIWFTRDDAYYYFKVAQNISEGLGSTFDGINPTNGYHPLWALVCVPIFALARIDLILPLRVLLLVLAAMRGITASLLYRLLDSSLSRPMAMLAALYWIFDYPIHAMVYQQGLETGLAALAIVFFLYLLQRFERDRKTAPFTSNRIIWLGFAAALMLFSRLDLVFLGSLLGLWIVFRDTPMRNLLPIDMLSLAVSALGAYVFRVGFPDYYLYAPAAQLTLGLALAIKIPALYFAGLYQHPASQSAWKTLRNAGLVILASEIAILGIVLSLAALGFFQGSFPRTAFVLDGALSLLLVLAARFGMRWFSTVNKDSTTPLAQLQTNWQKWLKDGMAYFLPFGGSLGIYMLWNKIAFGTATPVSGQIKRWWGSFPSRVYGGAARSPFEFFGLNADTDFNAWAPFTNQVQAWNASIPRRVIQMSNDASYLLFIALILLGCVLLLRIQPQRTRRIAAQLSLVPLLVGSGIQVLSYHIGGYSAIKEWYWVSQLVFIVLAAALLLDILSHPLRRIPATRAVIWVLVAYWGVSAGTNFTRIIINKMPYGINPNPVSYMDAATFLEQRTEPGSLIGMTGGGNVGYFIQDRTIVNMDGLINSYPYFLAQKEKTAAYYLANIGMDYVFANPNLIEGLPYRGQYTGKLEIIEYFGGKAVMKFKPEAIP